MIKINLKNQKDKSYKIKGQSLIEVLIGLGLFIIIIGAAFYSLNFLILSGKGNQERQKVIELAEDLINKVKVIAESDWLKVYDLPIKNNTGKYIVVYDDNLKIVEGKEAVLVDDVLSNLILYLKFDEATSSRIYDFSSFKNKVNLVNNLSKITDSCKINYCALFNGINQYGYVSSSNLFDLSSSGTVMAWVKLFSSSTYQGSNYPNLIGKGANAGWDTDGWGLFVFKDRRIGVGFRNGANVQTVYFYNDIFGDWIHIAGVWDGSKIYVYLNGEVKASSTQSVNPAINSAPLTIAKDNSSQYFHGYLDEARIYNRALTETEIKNIYRSTYFSRYFYIENVNRDVVDNIVQSGGYEDPSTQKITVLIEWLANKVNLKNFSISQYLTRWQNKVFVQDDWSGGPNENGIVIDSTNKFSSSTNIDFQGQPGQIKLILP